MFRLRASRNNDDVFLCQETKQYLCGRFPVLFSKGEHRRLLKHFIDPKVAALKSLKAAKKGEPFTLPEHFINATDCLQS